MHTMLRSISISVYIIYLCYHIAVLLSTLDSGFLIRTY